jgi:hypothetical protein
MHCIRTSYIDQFRVVAHANSSNYRIAASVLVLIGETPKSIWIIVKNKEAHPLIAPQQSGDVIYATNEEDELVKIPQLIKRIVP